MNRQLFERLSARPIRIASGVILAVALLVCYVYSKNWTIDWLLWKQRYDENPLSATPLEGITQRAELLGPRLRTDVCGTFAGATRQVVTTKLGGRTFYCYLLHGYMILLLDLQFDVFDKIDKYGVNAVMVCIFGAFILANLLMTKPVSQVFRPIFEPKLTGLFREPAEKSSADKT